MSTHTDTTNNVDATVLEYLKAATAASDRARTVLIVIITASVLVFTVIWNTGGWSPDGGGWLDARIALRERALELFNLSFDPTSPKLTPEDREAYERAKDFLKERHFNPTNFDHKDRLKEEVKDLSKIRTEQIRIIRVPFFGVAFDMNDLGLFAGITFAVVLLWLTFSVARERRNLKLTFKEAVERGQTKLCYDLLMMHQVLTVPPMRGHRFGRVWNSVPKLLYFIPAAVYLLQVQTDRQTSHIGNMLSPGKMRILVGANTTLLSLILIFTALCVVLSFGTDKIWQRAFADAYPEPIQDEGPRDGDAADAQAGDAVTP